MTNRDLSGWSYEEGIYVYQVDDLAGDPSDYNDYHDEIEDDYGEGFDGFDGL